MNFLKINLIFLIILLNLFNVTFMATLLEETCDAEDEAMAKWFHQVAKCEDRDQKHTQQIQELNEKFHLLEQKMEQTQASIEVIHKIVQQSHNTLHKYLGEMTTIVIQRRQDGSEDFYRTWNEYKQGFGQVEGDFFIGLEKLHKLTNSQHYELIITMEDFENNRSYAKYEHFVIGSELEKYALKSLGKYSGTSGDSLTPHLGNKFSTKDQDNDKHATINCAELAHGAWWYFSCQLCNLNGLYFNDVNKTGVETVYWFAFKKYHALKFVEMKIRTC